MTMPQASVTFVPLFLCLRLCLVPFSSKKREIQTRDTTSFLPCILSALLKMQTGLCLEAHLPVKDIHSKSDSGTQQIHTGTFHFH